MGESHLGSYLVNLQFTFGSDRAILIHYLFLWTLTPYDGRVLIYLNDLKTTSPKESLISNPLNGFH